VIVKLLKHQYILNNLSSETQHTRWLSVSGGRQKRVVIGALVA